jgi:hypothetical protein
MVASAGRIGLQTWEQMVAQSLTAAQIREMALSDRIAKMPAAEFTDYVRNGRHAEEARRG